MSKGPIFNNFKKTFTVRDNLGIDNIATSIQRTLCPVVNLVTPRAFYWMFMLWNYYAYIKCTKLENRNLKDFDSNFLKRNDYYFVLSNLLNNIEDTYGISGITVANVNINKNIDSFEYDRSYYKVMFGGMQYYNAGLYTLGFITNKDNDGNDMDFPKITKKYGEPLAIAFDNVIKETEYYKEYLIPNNKNQRVPKEVLIQLGKILNFKMEAFKECKELFVKVLFEPKNNVLFSNNKLISSAEFLKFLHKEFNIEIVKTEDMRKFAFDYFLPKSEHSNELPETLREIVNDWTIVIARQYINIGILLIWSYMLKVLDIPMNFEVWKDTCIKKSKFNVSIKEKLSTIFENCNFNYEEREKIIKFSRANENSLEVGLKIIIDIYQKLNAIENLEIAYLSAGDKVSISNIFQNIEEYKDRSIEEFLIYIMKEWIIEEHKKVAFSKMLNGKDGYFFEYIDNQYIRKSNFSPDFPGIRLVELNQVMTDLNMFGE